MPANTFTQFQYLPPMGIDMPGSPVQGGGGGTPQPFFRDELDATRSMWRRTPEAEYPDGYLGTIPTRRQDRLLQAVAARENQRSYQRGIHKGERVDQSDYFWPDDFNPMTSLQLEARGMKFAPTGEPTPRMVAEGKLMLAQGYDIRDDTHRNEQLRRLAPAWR